MLPQHRTTHEVFPSTAVVLGEKQTYLATDDERAVQNSRPALERLHGKALLVDGYWKRGVWRNLGPQGQKVMTLSCMTGAVAKCAHWGYVPNTPYGKADLTPYYQACVRAARAMYLEDSDKSFTCPGTEIDIYDRLNIVRRRSNPARKPESLWSADRATCIERTRWQGCDTRDGGILLPSGGGCDPGNRPLEDWPVTLPESSGLIAVSSSPDNNAGTCPDVIDDESKCRSLPSSP